ncbi:TIGR00730 family Rossman fold protein [Corynebacterium hansenii]|uniref:TIGR00730 family Rossman fold protein n=1 Tax=Corynebacterium hansenii TaxID=394964 RepID=A0ABV7ZNQ0_9CORY|nr:TIGR00730 family Rossman fold protein [Corynebacterium hansenii]WJY98759.1 LOG family protein ORF6 in fasciation locus [Corynebacterium hansenii]
MSNFDDTGHDGHPPILVAAVVVTDDRGRVLTVRKNGTDRFMLPGGKPEEVAGPDGRGRREAPAETVIREFREELGAELDPGKLADWGVVADAAANEPGHVVVGHHQRYLGPAPEVSPRAEIAEIRWVDPHVPTGRLAPMLANHTLPRLRDDAPARVISAVTVFAGSSTGNDPAWLAAAEELGRALGRERVEMVYGGASIGLMGAAADAVLAEGGQVTGVIPTLLRDREIADRGLTHLETVETMAQRKDRMYALGDAFVALPGGAGTLEEFFEVWTRQHIGIHQQPVALVGPGGFWRPLVSLIESLADGGLIHRKHLDSLIVVEDPADLLPALCSWRAPGTKWA